MKEFRVEALAEAAGLSVEVVRSYQSRGLLPPPRHEGRVAWYGRRHLDQLLAIRDLRRGATRCGPSPISSPTVTR